MAFDGGSRWCLPREDRDRGQWRASDKPSKWPGQSIPTWIQPNKCRTNKMRWASTALTLGWMCNLLRSRSP